jgi:transposase
MAQHTKFPTGSEIDLSVFDARYRNDETGASAYRPGVLLKVVLLGYARGLTSSRSIERACRENIVFMALSGDSAPTSRPSPGL